MKTRTIISDTSAGARINVTPMIDVVMVLIVFYLLVGQLALDRKASIALPSSSIGIDESDTTDPIVVGITTAGNLSINGQPIDHQRFKGEIEGMHARSPSTHIRIRADRDTPYVFVRPVMDQLRDAGIARVELVTEQSP